MGGNTAPCGLYTRLICNSLLIPYPISLSNFNESALAEDIDTYSGWDGSDNIWPCGYQNTLTYGQVFEAPSGKSSVTSFTFYLRKIDNSADLKYKAYIAPFDRTTLKITSDPIWSSDQKKKRLSTKIRWSKNRRSTIAEIQNRQTKEID